MLDNNVRKRRKELDLTLIQLSELTGIPVSTLSDIERGAEPRVGTAIVLANALKSTVEQLWIP